MTRFLAIAGRDLRLAGRWGSDTMMVIVFFVLAVVLFPFGVGPEAQVLARISAGVIWVTALLAAMLSLERLFLVDYEDGGLDILASAPISMELVVLAKCLAHWLTTGLPLIVISPLLAVLLQLEGAGYATLVFAMLLGTPTLTLLGAIGAALALGARRGGALLSLLVLPLYIPVLIFGVAAVDASVAGLSARPHLMFLGAFFLGALALSPWAAAAGLRQALE
ncbi:MAG: heme exporter protein CcmB [Alphaproteobacteria bacterium]